MCESEFFFFFFFKELRKISLANPFFPHNTASHKHTRESNFRLAVNTWEKKKKKKKKKFSLCK